MKTGLSNFLCFLSRKFPRIGRWGIILWSETVLLFGIRPHWLLLKLREELCFIHKKTVRLARSLSTQQASLVVDPLEVIGEELWKTKAYEPETTRILKTLLQPETLFFDIGANIGFFSVLASECVGVHGAVYSFEPDESNRSMLEENVRRNGCKNVTVEPYAISDTGGIAKLYQIDSRNSGKHSLQAATSEDRCIAEIEQTTLDNYCKKLSIKSVDVLKIDVEGAELLVLKGADQIIAESLPLIILEISVNTSRFGYSANEINRFLLEKGYILHDIGVLPLREYRGDGEKRFYNLLAVPEKRKEKLTQEGLIV